MKKLSYIFRVVATFLLAQITCLAGVYPVDGPITIVVPFPAGSPTDKVARELALTMSKSLGQTVLVENLAGAGGTMATLKVAQAAKDGYTILIHTAGMATASILYQRQNYDPLKDFDYIGQIVDVPMIVLGSKKFPPKNFQALIKYVKSHPDEVTIGYAGSGSAAHLCTLLLESELKTKLVSLPYRGSASALSDLIRGQIDLVCDQITSTSEQVKAGTVISYAITTIARVQPVENIPTVHEQGLAGFDLKIWHGLYAPRGLPSNVSEKLVQALQDAVRSAAFQTSMSALGGKVVPVSDATPSSLKVKLFEETARWSRVMRSSVSR